MSVLFLGGRRAASALFAFSGVAAAASVSLAPRAASADVTLPALFTPGLVLQREKPVNIWGKADPGEKVTVTLEGNKAETTAGTDGKWLVSLKPPKAGGPYSLAVAGINTITVPDVLVGEVWLCGGQSNMEFALNRATTGPQAIAASADNQIRLFNVANKRSDTPLDDVTASWQVCGPDTVGGFSAVAYFFARDLRKALNVPIGLIQSDWGGTPAQAWTRADILTSNPELRQLYVDIYPSQYATYEKNLAGYPAQVEQAKAEGKPAPRRPNSPWKAGELYNAMIAPLVNYSIRGAIWYQGEANAGNARGYRTLFPTMIENWRADFHNKDFPFLLVQLAPFSSGNSMGTNYAETREAQYLATQRLKNVGMAVITDVGEENDIHPRQKEPVGQRLALLAQKMVYKQKVVAMGPTFKSAEAMGNKMRVRFDNVGGGLEARGGITSERAVSADTLSGFTIAGPDGVFVPAEAKIVGKDTVEVSAPSVAMPTAVRFGFVNFPVVNLWNKEGLPANPFRSDMPL